MHTGSPTVFLKQVETVSIWPLVICEASQRTGMILIQSYEYLYSSLNAHKIYHFRVNCLTEMLYNRWLDDWQPISPGGDSSSRWFIGPKYPGMVSFAVASRLKFLKWPLKWCYSMRILVGHWPRMTNYRELISVLLKEWCPKVIVFQFQMGVPSRD